MKHEKSLKASGSIAIAFGIGGLLNPWLLTLACTFAVGAILLALKHAVSEANTESRVSALEGTLAALKEDIKKVADDTMTANNRVNMSIGMRK